MLPPYDPWRSYEAAAGVVAAARADGAALEHLRARRLADLFAAAARGSRLYREVLGTVDPARVRLQDMPVMRKADLMRRFDDWVTDPELKLDALRRFTADRSRIAEPFLGRYVVWESSGSSGEPGMFVQDAAAMAVYDALEALRRPTLQPWRRLLDPWCLGERIVFVGATSGHFASTVSIERMRRLNPALSGSLHGVSFLQAPDAMMAEIEALAPTVITTYPSAAVMLAEARADGRLKVAPNEIWTGGECLSPAMRAFVGAVFGCPVSNSYGASEFLALASECDHGRLHLNVDWAILESVDARGHAVPAGTVGATTLLTNLANHVQPLIRYDLGDQIALHAPDCACGSSMPVIDVSGRVDDVLRVGRSGRSGKAPVRILPLALCTVLEDDAGLFDFQLIQTGLCDLSLHTGLTGAAADVVLQRAHAVLTAFIRQQGASGVRIRCHAGAPGRRGRSGKIQRVVAMPGAS